MNDEVSRPHMCIINCQCEINSLTDKGECSGRVVSSSILEQCGLKPSFLLCVSGMDLENCIKNLKIKLNRWNDVNI
jgi:hypothetical protein